MKPKTYKFPYIFEAIYHERSQFVVTGVKWGESVNMRANAKIKPWISKALVTSLLHIKILKVFFTSHVRRSHQMSTINRKLPFSRQNRFIFYKVTKMFYATIFIYETIKHQKSNVWEHMQQWVLLVQMSNTKEHTVQPVVNMYISNRRWLAMLANFGGLVPYVLVNKLLLTSLTKIQWGN